MMPRFSALFLLLTLVLAGQVATAAPEQHFRDWRQQCESSPAGGQSCHITQQVLNPDNGALAMRVEVGFTPQGQPILLVTLPLGVALRPGVLVNIDGHGQWPVRFDVCTGDGCRAATVLEPELLRAMRRGSQAELTIADLSGRKVVLPLSLLGFTRGYASISK